MRKNKLLLLLALLLTAATGAWATDVYLVGNGSDGNWLNGVAWDTGAAANKMTEQNGVYSITYKDVDANSELLFKFAINGSWNENFGCTSWDANELNKTLSNIEAGGANFKFGLTEKADVTISFNLSEMTYMISTKGMKVGDDAATGYTVSMKDDVKDADKWTVKVGDGQAQALPIGGLKGDGKETVTLQYTGRLKVKGVKATSDAAAAAKTPATVTTAPTGAAIVGVGKTTALVSGGAAEGGTMMYKVTTDNTKPASTDGFSDAVPTAKDITASGKVYVWYYVKGDDTHTDSEISATAIEVPVADVVWDATNVSGLEIWGTDEYEMDGVKLSGNADQISAGWVDYGDPATSGIVFEPYESGGYTFTAPSGKVFTKIEMKAQSPAGWYGENLGTGWAYFEDGDNEIYTVTWTGSAASTDKLLPDTDDFSGAAPVKSIAFYLVDAE